MTSLDELYDKTKVDTASRQFFGCEIWKYFSQNLELDLASDNKVKNYLFILTDGYFDMNKYNNQKQIKNRYSTSYFLRELRVRDWRNKFDEGDYGLIPIDAKLSNISILVLEVNPKYNFCDEFDLLKKMWLKWFDEMGIQRKNVLKKNSFEVTKDQIRNFVE